MKTFRFFAAVCCMVLALTACGGYASESALIQAGQDLIAVMDEMVRSEEYAAAMLRDAAGFVTLREEVMAGDYDTPVAVYRITPPSAKELLRYVGAYDDAHWNGLSDTLKEQVENRVTFSNVIRMLNAQVGSALSAFSSLYVASKQDDALQVEEPTVLLYAFEKGTPIVMTFAKHGDVQGEFLFLEDASSLSTVTAAFEKYGCTVRQIK